MGFASDFVQIEVSQSNFMRNQYKAQKGDMTFPKRINKCGDAIYRTLLALLGIVVTGLMIVIAKQLLPLFCWTPH